MVLGALIPIAVLGLLIVAGAMLFNRGREGFDLAPRNLVRIYLYIASLAGIVVLVIGLSGILNAGFAATFGNGFVYGESPRIALPAPCPPGAAGCPPTRFDPVAQQSQQLDRRRAEDLLRGVTFSVFGLLFWGAHWAARRGALAMDEGQSDIRRAYFMIGTVIFGLTTIVLLPMGVYQALSNVILPPLENQYRPGAGEALAGGLVTLPAWLIYLWLVTRDLRAARAVPPTAT